MKSAWKNYIRPNLFYIVSIAILLPIYLHAVVLLIAIIYLIWQKRSLVMHTFIKNKWLSIFIIYVLIVSLINQNYTGVLITLVFFLFAIYFSSYLQWITIERYLKTLNIFVLGSIPVAIYALIVYLAYVFREGYTILYVFQYANVQTRAESTFFNPNYYGLFCIFAINIAMYLLLKSDYAKRFKNYYYASIALNLICILLTASRMVLPTVAVAIVWFIFWTKRSYVWYMLGVTAIGGIALIVNPDLIPRFSSIAYAFEDRFALWEVGWQIFLSNPLFGRGAMSYMNLYYLYTDKADMHAHQLGVNTLADYGILGVIILMLMLKDYTKSIIRLSKELTYRKEFALISTMIVTVIVHGMMDVSILWTQTGYIFLAVILPIQQLTEKRMK
ncbi:O-antigen ligase family protein [Aerococcaceae bacterium DSM 111021]|nr:O-antigen ligase family protein [Aerococcaceae bacterium DSM 111021]